ncbi:hypothetical protein GCM10025298_02880 [Natronobiforma cellulositropha]
MVSLKVSAHPLAIVPQKPSSQVGLRAMAASGVYIVSIDTVPVEPDARWVFEDGSNGFSASAAARPGVEWCAFVRAAACEWLESAPLKRSGQPLC